jgi:hypothetical protein
MHFLVLLPLTLLVALVGWLIASSPQIGEYVLHVSDVRGYGDKYRLAWQVGTHVLAYAFLCFALVGTVRTISDPIPTKKPRFWRLLQIYLEILFVAVPSLALIYICTKALIKTQDVANPLLLLTAIAVSLCGLFLTVLVTATRRPLDFFRSTIRPLSITKVDIVGLLVFSVIAAGIAMFVTQPVATAAFVGIFPVLFLSSAVALLMVAAIFGRDSWPVPVLSALVSTILALHLVDQLFPPAEFRYRANKVTPTAAGTPLPKDVIKARGVMELRPAFRAWLEHRRPIIEAFRKQNKTFPVFIVAAQGGGIYAAYHPSLTLARLYDSCPEFARHLFGISSVSGGGVGSALFAELLRGQKDEMSALPGTCTPRPEKLAPKVEAFFSPGDFLSPIFASAFILDIPSLFIPQLRFGLDRATALEYGLEAAWRRLELATSEGLAAPFYGRWKPDGQIPALFLAATGVNYGVPVIISDVHFARTSSIAAQTALMRMWVMRQSRGEDNKGSMPVVLKHVFDKKADLDKEPRGGAIANILDFRPDLSIATSTAIVLSARFPYVSPPASVQENKAIDKKANALYNNTEVMELIDGGLYDNSGGTVAVGILRSLESYLEVYEEVKEFKNDIKFHLIQFTDKPAQRHGTSSERGHFQLVTPLIAFNAVRLARGAQLADMSTLKRSWPHRIYLSDEWYRSASLNWLLSDRTKREIEIRSGGTVDPKDWLCCLLKAKGNDRRWVQVPLVASEVAELKKYPTHVSVEPFVPNAGTLERLIKLVKEGDDPLPPEAQKQAP